MLQYKIQIPDDDILNHHSVYTASLTSLLLGHFGAGKLKGQLYELVQTTSTLDEAIEKGFEFLRENDVYDCEDTDETKEKKR